MCGLYEQEPDLRASTAWVRVTPTSPTAARSIKKLFKQVRGAQATGKLLLIRSRFSSLLQCICVPTSKAVLGLLPWLRSACVLQWHITFVLLRAVGCEAEYRVAQRGTRRDGAGPLLFFLLRARR